MNFSNLVRSVYLGDRYCVAFYHNEREDRTVLEVNLISRIRDRSGNWNFYSDEDIPNGRLVFEGVGRLFLDPEGAIPNDAINGFEITQEPTGADGLYEFSLSIDSLDESGYRREVLIRISAKGFYLEDPRRPGVHITA